MGIEECIEVLPLVIIGLVIIYVQNLWSIMGLGVLKGWLIDENHPKFGGYIFWNLVHKCMFGTS